MSVVYVPMHVYTHACANVSLYVHTYVHVGAYVYVNSNSSMVNEMGAYQLSLVLNGFTDTYLRECIFWPGSGQRFSDLSLNMTRVY